jgi:hypothetical protein
VAKIQKQAYSWITSGVNRCSIITVILLWSQEALGMSAVLPTFWRKASDALEFREK